MNSELSVFITTRALGDDRLALLLEAMQGPVCRWSKIYDGALFLSMDAETLGILEPVPDPPDSGPHFRLKRSAYVKPEQLKQMLFVKDDQPEPQRQ